MADRKQRLTIADVSGGRNGFLPAWAIKDTECADAVNVDYYKTRFGNKRGGMADPGLTSGFTGVVSSLVRHVPGTSEAAAELWGTDDSGTAEIKRLAAGTAWSAPTLKDNPTGNGWDFTYASINGKLAIAYNSGANRMHFWDGSTVRRGGLRVTSTMSVSDTGGGAYAAVLRYYRQRSTVQVAGVTTRRSEPSAYVSFTPSGGGTAAHITQATPINEGETHWEIEASTDSVTFYRIATVVIGTTTYDDSAATTSYSTNTLSDLTGKYTVQKGYKFIAADQNRLLGFGSYLSTDKQNRIEISAVIGSADVGDEERVDTSQVNSYIDLDENDSGVPTGLCGPVTGSFFAFKDRQTCQLIPTGNTDSPYRQEFISKSIGALTHFAITRAEDQIGNAAVYWMSHRGPYRWSLAGLEYIGRGVEDYVLGGNATINLAATKVVARTLFYPDKRQVWFWWATGSSNDPNVCFFFDVLTGGWTRVPTDDALANIRCACLFANTIGATMSRDLKPYVGQTGGNNRIWKCDTGTDDNGTAFKAYIDTKAYDVGGEGYHGQTGDAVLLAKASNGVMITDQILADFETTPLATGVADLTPATTTETRVSRVVYDSGVNGVTFVQHRLGDAVPIANSWTLDRLVIPGKKQEAVSA